MDKARKCVLQDENECVECGKCDVCDIDPNKICDNCCKCLEEPDTDYAVIEVSDIPEPTEDMKRKLQETLQVIEKE